MMWQEQINERGVGNGVAHRLCWYRLRHFHRLLLNTLLTFNVAQIPTLVGLVVLVLVVIAGIVYITEAERPVPTTYALRHVSELLQLLEVQLYSTSS